MGWNGLNLFLRFVPSCTNSCNLCKHKFRMQMDDDSQRDQFYFFRCGCSFCHMAHGGAECKCKPENTQMVCRRKHNIVSMATIAVSPMREGGGGRNRHTRWFRSSKYGRPLRLFSIISRYAATNIFRNVFMHQSAPELNWKYAFQSVTAVLCAPHRLNGLEWIQFESSDCKGGDRHTAVTKRPQCNSRMCCVRCEQGQRFDRHVETAAILQLLLQPPPPILAFLLYWLDAHWIYLFRSFVRFAYRIRTR